MRRSPQSNSQVRGKKSNNIRVPVIISACLLGFRCRYDGAHSLCPALMEFLPGIQGVPVCPEQLGGLPTPRPAANIIGGDGADVLRGKAKLINENGEDVTEAFLKGAQEAFRVAHLVGAQVYISKKKSPSCGLSTPYCDSPSKRGLGVTAAFFLDKGLKVWELDREDPFPTPEFLEILRNIG